MQKDLPVTIDDIYKAYEDCRRKKKNKRGTVEFEKGALFNCIRIAEDINRRQYRLKPSECFIVEYPVPREVFCAAFRDRVVQHFVYNEVNPIIEKILINDTCSCRLGKGTDYAIKRDASKLRRISENYTKLSYVMKVDLSGFFMSINREWLCEKVMEIVNRYYTGNYISILRYLIPIIIMSDVTIGAKRLCSIDKWDKLPKRKTLFENEKGLAIGNITSQLFANFALNSIDHAIKSMHEAYSRYVDDMIIRDTDKNRLIETRNIIERLLLEQDMKLNLKKTIIQRAEYGVPFLGVINKPYYSILGKQRINRIYKCKRDFYDPYRAYQSIATRKGMFQRYHGINVAHRWFDSIPEDIREYIRMENDTSVTWLGTKPVDKKLLTLEALYV